MAKCVSQKKVCSPRGIFLVKLTFLDKINGVKNLQSSHTQRISINTAILLNDLL